jgi:hypothetical protein
MAAIHCVKCGRIGKVTEPPLAIVGAKDLRVALLSYVEGLDAVGCVGCWKALTDAGYLVEAVGAGGANFMGGFKAQREKPKPPD